MRVDLTVTLEQILRGAEQTLHLTHPEGCKKCKGSGGKDLWTTAATLKLPDAVLGTRIAVPTLEGAASVRVPPGTQPEKYAPFARQGPAGLRD